MMDNEKHHKKTLIRAVNWLGDAIMSMPAMRARLISKKDEHITLLANPAIRELFAHDPLIDSFINYEKTHKTFFGKLNLIKALKNEKFSEALLLQNAFDAAFIAFFSGINERIGYNRDGRGAMLTKRVPVSKEILKVHHIEYFINLVNTQGYICDSKLPWIYLTLDERKDARTTLQSLKRPVIGINTGAAFGPAKKWPYEHFSTLIQKLIKNKGMSVVMFGSKDDKQNIQHMIDSLLPDDIINDSDQFLNLCGKTSIRSLCAIISECDCLVTNDSGPMHIAYAVGTPVVAIFGSTDPALTGPPKNSISEKTGFKSTVCSVNTKCAPCFSRTCRYGHLECMEKVRPEYVYEEVLKILPREKAVFFDRDGTLCDDAHYLNCFEDFKLFPKINSLWGLKDKGYKLIGITNQSGIGRGIVDEGFVKDVNRVFMNKYGFDDFLYCPHLPTVHCPCRKPSPGLLYKSRALSDIDLKSSFFVGDKDSDILSAQAVGAKPVYIKTPKYKQSVNNVETIECLGELDDIII